MRIWTDKFLYMYKWIFLLLILIVGDELVESDECSSSAHTSAAVDQDRSSVSHGELPRPGHHVPEDVGLVGGGEVGPALGLDLSHLPGGQPGDVDADLPLVVGPGVAAGDELQLDSSVEIKHSLILVRPVLVSLLLTSLHQISQHDDDLHLETKKVDKKVD